MPIGRLSVMTSGLATNLLFPAFRKTVNDEWTGGPKKVATTKSSLPSLLKSPTATEPGPASVGYGPSASWTNSNPPGPELWLNRIVTCDGDPVMTARSGLPSLLKSPTVTKFPAAPPQMLRAEPNDPPPRPGYTTTPPPSPTIRSSLASRSRSAVV